MENGITKIMQNHVISVPGQFWNSYQYSDILDKDLLDHMLDEMLDKMPNAKILIISPKTHKATGIGRYQYRNLKVKIDPNCPNPTIYLKK